ncbi:MAG TPA: hypothetical protein VHN99_03375, partial [Deinococcales bacterium]|nr:hypothetical protein [Deinococcales bacterium]
MGSVRRVVASTVAGLLGISELRARALLGPKGPLAEHVLERPNPHHYTGPKMRVVPLDVVMAWADEHGEVLTRWQAQRDRTNASRD